MIHSFIHCVDCDFDGDDGTNDKCLGDNNVDE